ncbi:(E2-independent) E3 ubiquitin-conjugating enzyme FATS isoform X1 [Ascaphus truei]|uniref:(E2-independent) E3 ubiquitin-conjugating enzyme FATS isoform X1 n=1 Tax=Ascaphus truei TaxID=8439 RepID=UPI003F5A7CFF
MPSQERIPVFPMCIKQRHMDFESKPAEQDIPKAKSFVTEVHLTLHYSFRKKACCFGLKGKTLNSTTNQNVQTILQDEAGENAHHNTKSLGSYNAKLISSILVISQMIDENKSEDYRFLFPMHSVIAQPNSYHTKQSMAYHNAVSINRAFTLLPSRLESQTSLDKTIFRTNLYPSEEKKCLNVKKGFASITITARRNVPSTNHALKEITSDPASSMSRSNDLLMKGPISSNFIEHDQHRRHLCNQEYYAQSYRRCGVFNSQECCSTSYPDFISNPENNNDFVRNNHHNRIYMSCVYLTTHLQFPAIVYYVDRSLSLPISQPQITDQKMHKSAMHFKINRSPSRAAPDSVYGTASRETMALHRHCLPNDNSTTIGKENKELNPVRNQPPLINDRLTDNTTSPEFLSKIESVTDPSRKIEQSKCKDGQGNEEKQPDGHPTESCTHVSNCPHIKASSQRTILKEVCAPGNDIYLQKHQSHDFINLVPERSTVTTFNVICGRQTSKLKKEKQDIHKENIPPNGFKRRDSIGKTGDCCEKNMQLPTVSEKIYIILQSGKFYKNKDISPEIMSLREALEHYRPDFLCKSQKRVLQLELMAQRRKQQNQDSTMSPRSPLQKLPLKTTYDRRKFFTVPHPLSDNLFKPKERAISEKEMQQRSKRIYNTLPEVTKKKEEEEKRMISESNRMRVELFKKKLLDQIHHRNVE